MIKAFQRYGYLFLLSAKYGRNGTTTTSKKIERQSSIPRKYVIVLVVSSAVTSFITAFVVSSIVHVLPRVSFTSSNVKANVNGFKK